MDALRLRAVAGGRNARAQLEQAHIGGAGGGIGHGRCAVHDRVAARQQAHRCRIEIDHASRRVESFEANRAFRRLGQFADRRADRPFDFLLRFGRIAARIDAEAEVDATGGRHRRGPLAARDLAEVEVERMRMVAEQRMRGVRRIPARLDFLQALPHVHRGLDRVQPLVRLHRMRGAAGQVELAPHGADLAAHDRFGEGFGVEHRVDGDALRLEVLDRGQRAVAGAFLLDHGVEPYRPGGADAEIGQGLEAGQRGDQAALHVARAAAIKPAVPDVGLERRPFPQRQMAGGHHVDMTAHHQRFAALARRAQLAQQVVAAVQFAHHRRIQGVRGEHPGVDGDLAHLEALLGEQLAHHGLRRLLMAGKTLRLDQAFERGQHPGLAGMNRVPECGVIAHGVGFQSG